MNRRTLLTSALFALGAGRLPLPAWIGPAASTGKGLAARPVAVRRTEISRRLQAVRLRQCRCAERRRGARDRDRHLRQFQHRRRRRQRRVGDRHRLYLRNAVDARHSTRCRAEYGLLAEAVSHPDDFSSASYRLRAEAKWHDGKPVTPEDVIFSFNAFKKHSPQLRRLLPPRRQGGENRRSRNHLHVRRARQSRIAADRRPASGPAAALVGRHRQERQQARHRRDHARAAARQRRLSHQGVFARPQHRLRAREGLLGRRDSTSMSAATISTNSASNISAIRRSRSKRSRATRSIGEPRTAPRTGRPPTISPPSRKAGSSSKSFRSAIVGVMQAFAFNIRRAKFQDPRVRLAFNYAFDFEEMNKQIFFGQYKRIASYFQGTELASSGLPDRTRAGDPGNGARQGPRRSFSPRPISNPVGGDPQAVRNNLREAVRLFKEAGYEVRDGKLVNGKTGEPYCGRISRRRSELRARVPVLQAFARPARRHGNGAHASTMRNT